MPELPDITVYLEALESPHRRAALERVVLKNPFLLRTADPPLQSCEGHASWRCDASASASRSASTTISGWCIHLMIAGRLHWYDKSHTRHRARVAARISSSTNGMLTLTEAGTKRRASLHVLRSAAQLADHDRGGLEVLGADPAAFRERLSARNHTLKRALTDPTILSGIGNAYSDEILHRARLSPTLQTRQLNDAEWQRLYEATQATLTDWIERLRAERGRRFPGEGHRLPQGHGRAWPLRQALPGLRHRHPAHSLRRKRNELLPALPDRRQAARRPLAFAAAQGRLAEDDRGAGEPAKAVSYQPSCTARIAPDRRSIDSSSSCGTGKARRSRTRRIGCCRTALRPDHQSLRRRDAQLQRTQATTASQRYPARCCAARTRATSSSTRASSAPTSAWVPSGRHVAVLRSGGRRAAESARRAARSVGLGRRHAARTHPRCTDAARETAAAGSGAARAGDPAAAATRRSRLRDRSPHARAAGLFDRDAQRARRIERAPLHAPVHAGSRA